jgi:hypothetical protein
MKYEQGMERKTVVSVCKTFSSAVHKNGHLTFGTGGYEQ